MLKADAYIVLTRELEVCRQLPKAALLARVDAPPQRRSLDIAGEPVDIELSAFWADTDNNKIRILAVAYGPSTLNIERREESVIVNLKC